MIVLDTSGVVALVDLTDERHRSATRFVHDQRPRIVVPSGITAEIAYMLAARGGERAVLRFIDGLIAGTTQWDCGDQDLPRVRDLMVPYADLLLGYADATAIACAERLGANVFSFDDHFAVVALEGTIAVVPV